LRKEEGRFRCWEKWHESGLVRRYQGKRREHISLVVMGGSCGGTGRDRSFAGLDPKRGSTNIYLSRRVRLTEKVIAVQSLTGATRASIDELTQYYFLWVCGVEKKT